MAGRDCPLQESCQLHLKHMWNAMACYSSIESKGKCRGCGMRVGKAGTGGRKKTANEQQRTEIKLDVG